MADEQLIDSPDALVDLMGAPNRRAAEKVRPVLHPVDRAWIARSPFLLMATSDADGRCDVSPKGDPPGFVHVLDDTTLVVPERPGNRRVDGYHNVLANPHVGLIFLVPGRDDTLRVNGAARLVRDADWFDDLVVGGHRPVLALRVEVQEVFFHCAKAFLRSRLWSADPWSPDELDLAGLPSTAQIAHALSPGGMSLAELERYYGPEYAERIYVETAARVTDSARVSP